MPQNDEATRLRAIVADYEKKMTDAAALIEIGSAHV